ncbi:MAG: flippase-like domain-containing protein [Proteobacteria bacterium]|nr:flippase-like domain-containing protein [Pseudomonadota bacterium]
MRHLKFAYLLIGIAILALVVGEIELEEVAALVVQVGWGIAAVVGVYFLAFVIDSFTWQMALTGVPLDAVWLYRMWKVRMVGEVFNTVLPAAGMGGEPVKAVLLKKHYGVGYREGTASLILAKTINMIALVVFLSVGFVLMAYSPALPGSYKSAAGLGLGAFALGIFLFFAIQRLKISSVAGSWIGRRRLGRRIEGLLHHVRDMDDRLAGFYSGHGVRFAGAIGLALVNWLLGAVEIYVTMIFLGRPISLADAWIIESAAQLVRAGTFFIPASIGAQEGVFLLVYGAMTGSPALGAAVAVVRRLREIIWILWGLLLGSIYTFKPAHDE